MSIFQDKSQLPLPHSLSVRTSLFSSEGSVDCCHILLLHRFLGPRSLEERDIRASALLRLTDTQLPACQTMPEVGRVLHLGRAR